VPDDLEIALACGRLWRHRSRLSLDSRAPWGAYMVVPKAERSPEQPSAPRCFAAPVPQGIAIAASPQQNLAVDRRPGCAVDLVSCARDSNLIQVRPGPRCPARLPQPPAHTPGPMGWRGRKNSSPHFVLRKIWAMSAEGNFGTRFSSQRPFASCIVSVSWV